MKQPKRPTLSQKKIIVAAGLDPERWSVTSEDKLYLRLVDRGIERRESKTINKKTKKIIEAP